MATLLGLGLFMVFSASFTTQGTDFFLKQIAWIALGVVACGVMAFIPYGVWRQLAIPIMVMTIVVLAAVLALGNEAYGGTRRLLGSSIQPSEFAKLAVTIYVAAWVAARGDKITGFQDGLMPFMIILFSVTGLIVLQHSFSVTIIVLCIGLTIFFVGGGNLKQIGIVLAVGIPALVVAMALSEYPLKRMQDWYALHFNPAAISPDTLRILALLQDRGRHRHGSEFLAVESRGAAAVERLSVRQYRQGSGSARHVAGGGVVRGPGLPRPDHRAEHARSFCGAGRHGRHHLDLRAGRDPHRRVADADSHDGATAPIHELRRVIAAGHDDRSGPAVEHFTFRNGEEGDSCAFWFRVAGLAATSTRF